MIKLIDNYLLLSKKYLLIMILFCECYCANVVSNSLVRNNIECTFDINLRIAHTFRSLYFVKAEVNLVRACKLQPSNDVVWMLLGEQYWKHVQFSLALECFDKAYCINVG